MGILGMTNMEAGFKGFQDVIKKYPEMEFIGKYDDKANVEVAAKITADLIVAHPDLAGVAGFDGNSGPGIALSVKEANKIGKIKITTVDAEPEHLQLPDFGSRTWMWAMAAPAFAASIDASAICLGVTGTCGLLPAVAPAPVTAHVMKAS